MQPNEDGCRSIAFPTLRLASLYVRVISLISMRCLFVGQMGFSESGAKKSIMVQRRKLAVIKGISERQFCQLSVVAHYFGARSDSDLPAGELEPEWGNELLLEKLPPGSVQLVAELAVVVDLSPAVATPFTASHVDHKITVFRIIVDHLVNAVVVASIWRERVDLTLLNECRVWSDPWVNGIEILERILLLVLPLHVFLLVAYWVPPDIQKAISPCATLDEERAKVESAAVLRHNHVNRGLLSITNRRQLLRRKIWLGKWVSDVEWVVVVDIAVGVGLEVVENMRLKRNRWLHDECVLIKPPEPRRVSC